MTANIPVVPPTNIHEALSRASKQIGHIGKGSKNTDLGYAFRGIDAILDRAGPILADLGVTVAPVHKLISSEQVTSKKGALGYRVLVETAWTFTIHVEPYPESKSLFFDHSTLTAQTLGESIDYSDKAVNKAQTQSFKNVLAQVLKIPTGEADPDEETPEQVEPLVAADEILSRLESEGFNKTAAKKYAKEAMEVLELVHPIPDMAVDDVVGQAVMLRNEAEAAIEGADADVAGGYG